MGQIRDRMVADLALRGAAPQTCIAYLRYAAAFVAWFMVAPTELGTEDVRTWILTCSARSVAIPGRST